MDISPHKNEIAWVHYCNKKGTERYLVTSDRMRATYYLYQIVNGDLVRIAKAESPDSFKSKIKL